MYFSLLVTTVKYYINITYLQLYDVKTQVYPKSWLLFEELHLQENKHLPIIQEKM